MAVIPQTANIVLPSSGDRVTATPTSTVLLCGVIETGVSDMNSTWYTPTGDVVEVVRNLVQTLQEGRLRFFNLQEPVGALLNVTSLTINRLSYLDEGDYVCSIAYTLGDSETIVQRNATVSLQLKGNSLLLPITQKRRGILIEPPWLRVLTST